MNNVILQAANDSKAPSFSEDVRDWFRRDPKRGPLVIGGIALLLLLLMALFTDSPEKARTTAPVPTPIAFTVAAGDGLTRYVDFDLSIAIAERFGLPLYEGRQMRADKRISAERARQLEPFTAERQVTVGIAPGTSFVLRNPRDPATWSMIPSGVRVRFP